MPLPTLPGFRRGLRLHFLSIPQVSERSWPCLDSGPPSIYAQGCSSGAHEWGGEVGELHSILKQGHGGWHGGRTH